jgi:hypothetical protein
VSLKAPSWEAGRRHDGATSEPAPAAKTAETPQQLGADIGEDHHHHRRIEREIVRNIVIPAGKIEQAGDRNDTSAAASADGALRLSDNDPGPQTLFTSVTPEMNVARLHWVLSRMQGYVGISGYMGARCTASEQAVRPVLTDAAKRGLIYGKRAICRRRVHRQLGKAGREPRFRPGADQHAGAGRGPQRAAARSE